MLEEEAILFGQRRMPLVLGWHGRMRTEGECGGGSGWRISWSICVREMPMGEGYLVSFSNWYKSLQKSG